MTSVSRKDLVMLLVGLGDNHSVTDGLGGITRLQKYLFLLEKESRVSPDESGKGFRFEAYKAGPYSSKLYDDIEFLENLGYLQGRVTGTASEPEEAELDALTFDDLVGEEPEARAPAMEERAFTLTEKGKSRVRELMENSQLGPVVDGVRKVKSRFASHSLNDLLRYVYQKYPEMTTESEIKDKVLGRKWDR